jgi:hypothetical protein
MSLHPFRSTAASRRTVCGVLMGPASAGLIPTNPGPRFPDRAYIADPT